MTTRQPPAPTIPYMYSVAARCATEAFQSHMCSTYVPCNLRICAISRLRCAFSESRDCALELRDLEIAQYTFAISRLRTYSAQSFTPTRMCRNHPVVMREATKNGDFVSVLQNSRVQAMIVWLSLA